MAKGERLKPTAAFIRKIGEQEARKLKAQQEKTQTIWFGFATFGLIGWSIVVPTLLGVALGAWLDKHHRGTHSWTLALLVAGLLIGCANAWHWVAKEEREMLEDGSKCGRDEHGN